ncbi:MAG: hypothetical protein K5978_08395 [Campylobacter sp.]|nr:hypothetical protein [Campylobacter sp.]
MRIHNYSVAMTANKAYYQGAINLSSNTQEIGASNYTKLFEKNGDVFDTDTQNTQANSQIRTPLTRSNPLGFDDVALNSAIKSFAKHGITLASKFRPNALDSETFSQALNSTQTHIQSEALTFSTKAIVQTSNGKSLDIGLNYNISSQMISFSALKRSELYDPLVITLDGQFPELGARTFEFDIDCDGCSDQISTLGQNSGFLALDRNANGLIDDATELFGTKSGNGFGELSFFDEDENGWIDENDSIFDKLRIWLKSDKGDRLVALGEIGLGAIFLGSISSIFSMRDEANDERARLTNSGFALFENGNSALLAQLDMAKLKKADKFSLYGLNFALNDEKITSNLSRKNMRSKLFKSRIQNSLNALYAKLSALNAKLSASSPERCGSIRTQIGLVNAQIFMLKSMV